MSGSQQCPPENFQVVDSWVNDARARVAAGKLQRWDIVKWAITVNLALATASVGLQKSPRLFFIFAVLMAAIAGALVWHVTLRMTRARGRLQALTNYVVWHIFDVQTLLVEPAREKGAFNGETRELWLYAVALTLSVVPSLIVWLSQRS